MTGTPERDTQSESNIALPLASEKEKRGTLPPRPHHLIQADKWRKNPELARQAGLKGGAAKIKTPHYSRCIDCDFRTSCPERFKEAQENRERGKELIEKTPDSKNAMKLLDFSDDKSRCLFELQDRKGRKTDLMRDYKAFVSMTPENTLEKLHMLFKKLEGCVDSDPSYTKLASLFYMMMNIYKMKFGKDAPQVAIQVNNSGNPSVDIKAIMEEMRNQNAAKDKKEEEEYVNTFATPPTEEEGSNASDKDMKQFKFAPDPDKEGDGA